MREARLLRSIRAATDVMRSAAIDLCLERTMDRLQRLLRELSLEQRYNPDWTHWGSEEMSTNNRRGR